jgi:hypothetical protein
MGYFMNPDFLSQHRYSLASLIRNVPALQVTRTRTGQEIALGRTGNRLCVLSVFIDGTFVNWASALGLDNLMAREDLLAIEVYPHPTDVPMKFLAVETLRFSVEQFYYGQNRLNRKSVDARVQRPISEQIGWSLGWREIFSNWLSLIARIDSIAGWQRSPITL